MFNEVFWPQAQLGSGINRLATQLGGAPAAASINAHTPEQYAYAQGLEAAPTQSTYGNLQDTLEKLAPGIVAITCAGEAGFLMVGARRGRHLYLLAPNGGQQRYTIDELIEQLRIDRDLKPDPILDSLLDELGLQGRRLQKARQLLIQQKLDLHPMKGLWILRPHPNRGLKAAALHARLGYYAGGFIAAHILGRLALLAGLSLLGWSITQGVWTSSMILTWLLIMLSHWWLGAAGQACQLQLNVRAGVIIKRQLQHSALHLPPDAIATKGPAQLLGQALEAEGLHNNALAGLFTAMNAAIDIIIALVIGLLMQQWLISLLLVLFVLASIYPVQQFVQAYGLWAKRRVQLSYITIEHMQGNRTRLMQSGPDRWHKEEEHRLHNYWLASRRMDKFALWLQAIIPGCWLVAGCLVLCTIIFFAAAPLVELAALLGVILLAWQAWHGIADSSQQLARTWYSWQQVLELLAHNAATQLPAREQQPAKQTASLVEANQLTYSYHNRPPVIRDLVLRLQQGQQYLLQGESGSGKSTLLALIAGQLQTQHGWLLFNERDLSTWGEQQWRKKICWVPQHHDNYIFSGSLLFNLMLGHSWPPGIQDMKTAVEICDKLGLLPLLNKMPAGLLQPIGEMGWQLSQGEASRVYLARALLQNPQFLLLDESLGALDSTTSLQILTNLQSEPAATLLCMHP